MNCDRIELFFSDLYDDALQPSRAAELRAHLEGCAHCSAEYAAFSKALDALRSTTPSITSPELRGAILAAVDGAAAEDAEIGEDVFERAVLIAGGRASAREGRRRSMTHALAALLGAAAVFFWMIGLERPDRGGLEAQSTEALDPRRTEALASSAPLRGEPAERVVERIVEVPIEVFVEVEVPVIEYRDRIVEVPRAPRQTVARTPGPFEAHFFAQLAAHMGAELARRSHGAELEPLPVVTHEDPLLAAAAQPARKPVEAPFVGRAPSSSLRVSVEDGFVSLVTLGSLGTQVDALWGRLADPDQDVAAAVQKHLALLRQRAESDPELGPRLVVQDEQDDSSWLRGVFQREPRAEPSWSEDWFEWWERNGEIVAAAEGF